MPIPTAHRIAIAAIVVASAAGYAAVIGTAAAHTTHQTRINAALAHQDLHGAPCSTDTDCRQRFPQVMR